MKMCDGIEDAWKAAYKIQVWIWNNFWGVCHGCLSGSLCKNSWESHICFKCLCQKVQLMNKTRTINYLRDNGCRNAVVKLKPLICLKYSYCYYYRVEDVQLLLIKDAS